MTDCVYQTWTWWLVASLVFATSGIVFVATWSYMQDKYYDLLREVAAERAANQSALQDVRMRQRIYGDVTMGDLDREETS